MSEEDIKKFIGTLDTIVNDESVPKNIRRSADKMKKILSNEKVSPVKRTAQVISELEIIGNDTNMPMHTRTKVWGLTSQLESISAKIK